MELRPLQVQLLLFRAVGRIHGGLWLSRCFRYDDVMKSKCPDIVLLRMKIRNLSISQTCPKGK